MDYDQIKVFLAIVDTNSVSKAADMLFVSQSTISKKLRSLEDELGIHLLHREKGQRHVSLTPDGERFYPLAKEYQNTSLRLEKFKESESRDTLRIASVDSLNNSVFRNLYPILLNRLQHLELVVTTNQTNYIYELVNRQDFDLGFVLSEYRWPNIIVTPFIRQRFKLIIYSSQPMDSSCPISVEELDPTKEIFQPWGPSFQQWHEYWWPKNGYRIKIDTLSMVDVSLFQENYWTIVPDSVANLYRDNPLFHILDLANPPPERQCYIIRNKYPQMNCIRAMKEFESILSEYQENYQKHFE